MSGLCKVEMSAFADAPRALWERSESPSANEDGTRGGLLIDAAGGNDENLAVTRENFLAGFGSGGTAEGGFAQATGGEF